MILYFIFAIAIGSQDEAGIVSILTFAGNSPIAFKAVVLLDGLFHVLFFITAITLFVILRQAYPVSATLILVCGAWQMPMGFTKGMIASMVFPQLGSEYLAADAALRATFLPTANAMDSLRNAMQWMDSFGIMFVCILVSLLPRSTGLPPLVRWIGWIMAIAILSPDPAFVVVVLLSPFWLFSLGLWMKRLADLKPEVVKDLSYSSPIGTD